MKKSRQEAVPVQFGEFSDGIHGIIQLFSEHDAALQFPGINAQSLREQADEVEQLQKEVEAQEALAVAARERLTLCTARLLERARQAQAYAEVVVTAQEAEATDELTASLKGIDLSAASRTGRKRMPRARASGSGDSYTKREVGSPQSSEVNDEATHVAAE